MELIRRLFGKREPNQRPERPASMPGAPLTTDEAIVEVFRQVVATAGAQRPGLREAMGTHEPPLPQPPEAAAALPLQVAQLFQVADGVVREKVVGVDDIVPGYSMMQAQDILTATSLLQEWDRSFAGRIPFMEDYGGAYFLLDAGSGEVLLHLPEEPLGVVSRSMTRFWQTVLRCYTEGVYRLDEDGWLDCDPDREARIGEEMNPGCDGWT